jgi:hypothetical protein
MKPYPFLPILVLLLASCGRTGLEPGSTTLPAYPAATELIATSTVAPIPVATEIAGPAGLSIEIYALQGPPGTDPLTFSPVQGTQAQILLNHQIVRDQDPLILLDKANQALQPFGYKIETNQPSEIVSTNTYTLTKDGYPIFNQRVSGFMPVSVNSDGTDFMMAMDAAGGEYLVNTKGVQKGGLGVGPGLPPPVFVNDEVLTATQTYSDTTSGSNGQAIVSLDNREIFTTSIGSPSPVSALRGLWSDGNTWTLEVARTRGDSNNFQVIGEIYQDGISLNLKFGFQSTFGYQILGDKPFYFYQKNDQIGISYDGQEIPLGFEEIPHYNCCSGAELNPRQYTSLVDLFARKGQAWYFVEIITR